MPTSLPILHFNDVYRVQPYKLSPKSPETIDVTQWAAMVEDVRNQWYVRSDGKRDGLLLFSGDIFSPSVESSVTRGSHMVPVINTVSPDVAMTGNHDFDFGYPHLTELIKDTNFPWLLSNIVDTKTSAIPEHVHEFHVLERAGIRIGVIGLVEKEWIGTVPTWPDNFIYREMAEVGIELSKRLRDLNGQYKCDLIIALTHARVPNDLALAKALKALSPSAQEQTPIASEHGVDLILGGHDHLYYVSHGVTAWDGYDITAPVLGAEEDKGDILVVKSGCDFRDLSEFTLELADTPPGSVRTKVIKSISGKRHRTEPGSKKHEQLGVLLKSIMSSVSDALKAPVCKTTVELDLRSQLIRTQEVASSNWFADVLRHAYDEAPTMGGGSDGVFICAGTLRGDSVYGPGVVSLGDILEILPFEDPVVALELDGESIWDALEQSLSTWPAQEGRFPVISGFRVSWDSRRPPGQRVLGVWLVDEPSVSMSSSTTPSATPSASSSAVSLPSPQTPTSGTSSPAPTLIDGDPIPRIREGRKYRIVTREYMAKGHDGFIALKGKKYLVDDESGQMMSQLVRKYLLGCRFVNRMSLLGSDANVQHLHPDTVGLITREKARQEHYARVSKTPSHRSPSPSPSLQHHHRRQHSLTHKWKNAMKTALRWSRAHYRDHIHVTGKEHMSAVDSFNGKSVRRATVVEPPENLGSRKEEDEEEDDLPVIQPVVDGRLRNEGRK